MSASDFITSWGLLASSELPSQGRRTSLLKLCQCQDRLLLKSIKQNATFLHNTHISDILNFAGLKPALPFIRDVQPSLKCLLDRSCMCFAFYLWSIGKLLSWMDWEGGRWAGKTRSGLGVWAEFGEAWCSGDTGVLDGVGGLEGLIPTCGFWS